MFSRGKAIINEIEDTYPLSPLQQGMLFHTLLAPGSGVDIEQLLFELDEALDGVAFQHAWRCVIARHPALRTNFRWGNLDEPRQEVRTQVELPWEEQDWRGIAGSERDQRFADWLSADRLCGFDLARAPLFHLTLLRYGETEFRLIWTFHHAVLEGRSLLLALREVFAFYEAFCRGSEITLPLPRPYRDYITWLQQQDFSKDEAFWRETLKGFTTSTPLAVDHAPDSRHESRPAHKTQEAVLLSTQITSALRTLAQENRLSLNTIVQGAWALLLSRYSGEVDVVFGVIRSNRRFTIDGAEAMIGLFLNTLPLRVRVNPEAALIPWLKEVRLQWMAMHGHEHTPLAKVQGWSEVPGGTSLFQSTMLFENYHLDTMLRKQGGAWSNRRFRLFVQTNYPLGFAAYDGPELRLRMAFDSSRIDDAAVGRMVGHLRSLLEGMAINPQQKVGELPLLNSTERHQLLVEWNQTRRDYPRDKCVHQLFEAQVARTPDAVAVECEGLSFTYRELNVKANRLAHRLRALGVGPDVPVGILLERSLDAPVAVLGVLIAGGAFVPLTPELPPERIGFILHDTQARVLITRTKMLPRLAATQAEVVCLDSGRSDGIKSSILMATAPSASPSNLAYVIYTSGSTGEPKGVLVTQGQIALHCLGMIDFYGLSPADRMLHFASLGFDVAIENLLAPLLAGARVVLRGPDLWDPATLTQRIHECGLTVINLTPSYWQQWLDSLDARTAADSLGSLRLMISGGDVMPVAGVHRWRELHLEKVRLVNMYGPTEATISACGFEVDANWPQSLPTDRVPIGRPLANRCAYILDHHMHPVAIGVAGELYLGGEGIARGYLNRGAMTAERFLPDPFGKQPDARLYRTGDLARYLPDGKIEFLGRADHQVKVRGYRIELGEIESTLQQHPAVRECVVVVREDAPGDKRLAAYVTPTSPSHAPVGELRKFLAQKLPAYMVPSAFVLLDAFPLTPSGKLDRRALSLPDEFPSLPSTRTVVAPRNDLEIALISAWERVLRTGGVGITDNYFDLGGHSIMALDLALEMETATGIKFDLADIFSAPTIEGLIARLALNERNNPSVIVPLNKTAQGVPLFCLAGIELYRELAQALEGVCPVLGIFVSEDRAIVRDAAEGRLSAFSLEQLAESYYAAIRRSNIAGPYQLGGVSMGGVIALEVAARLEGEGETVNAVYLFDTILSRFISRTALRRIAHWVKHAVLAPIFSKSRVRSDALAPEQVRRQSNLKVISKVQTVNFPKRSEVYLFRAKFQAYRGWGIKVAHDYGWSALLGRPIKVIEIPGDHLGHVKNPNAALVAEHIKAQVHRVQ